MKGFLVGIGIASLLSVAVAVGNSHGRQSSNRFQTRVERYSEFTPDEYVTDGPGYLRSVESTKQHSSSFWTNINALAAQGWEPVCATTTVSQYQTGKGATTTVVLKLKLD